jgi:hypothetical protein
MQAILISSCCGPPGPHLSLGKRYSNLQPCPQAGRDGRAVSWSSKLNMHTPLALHKAQSLTDLPKVIPPYSLCHQALHVWTWTPSALVGLPAESAPPTPSTWWESPPRGPRLDVAGQAAVFVLSRVSSKLACSMQSGCSAEHDTFMRHNLLEGECRALWALGQPLPRSCNCYMVQAMSVMCTWQRSSCSARVSLARLGQLGCHVANTDTCHLCATQRWALATVDCQLHFC